jgi:hypothetical protein
MDVAGGDSRTRWIKSADKCVMSFGLDTSHYTSPLPHCTEKHFQHKTLPTCSLSLGRLRSPQYNLSLSKRAADWSGEVLSFTHWPPLAPGMFLVLILIREWVEPRAMVRSEGSTSLKNPVTPGPSEQKRSVLTTKLPQAIGYWIYTMANSIC